MKLRFVIISSIVCVLVSFNSFAQKTGIEKKVMKTAKITGEQNLRYQEVKKSSYDNRLSKNLTWATGLGFELLKFGPLITTDYFINADSLVSLRLAYVDDKNDSREDSQISSSLQFKQFVSNSFYIKSGLYYRDLKKGYTRPFIFFNDTSHYHIRDAGITFNIGNQWSFNKLTLGCDWFGANHRVTKIKESGDADFMSVDDEKISFNFLSFYIGFSI